MPNKNDLSHIKAREKLILEKTGTKEKKSNAGRKKKDPSEKESELIPLKLLPSEYDTLVKKAGLVKVSTYLKHLIRTETDWLKDT